MRLAKEGRRSAAREYRQAHHAHQAAPPRAQPRRHELFRAESVLTASPGESRTVPY
jgi:hypothetical protein